MSFDSAEATAGTDALATEYNDLRRDVVENAGDYNTSTGSANAYLLSVDSTITALSEKQVFKFKANFDNTGAVTLDVNGIGAESIFKAGGQELIAGDIITNQIVVVIFDGTQFKLVSPPSNTQAAVLRRQQFFSNTTEDRQNVIACSNADGSIIVAAFNEDATGSNPTTIVRYELEPISGTYFRTDSVDGPTIANSGQTNLYPTILGSFVYIVFETSPGVMAIQRHDLADLANPTAITISGGTLTDGANYNILFNDATSLYLQRDGSGGDFNRYTVSGTTITFQEIITYSADISDAENSVVFANSTHVFGWSNTDSKMVVFNVDGSGGEQNSETFGENPAFGEGQRFRNFGSVDSNTHHLKGILAGPGNDALFYFAQMANQFLEVQIGSSTIASHLVIFPFKRTATS